MWLYHLLSSFACICFFFFLLKEVFIFISIIHKYSLFLFEYERYSALVSPQCAWSGAGFYQIGAGSPSVTLWIGF